MEKQSRHLIYGVIFVLVFATGSVNVITDGGIAHLVSSQTPWHPAEASSTPEIEIENNLTLAMNETGEVKGVIRNADSVSYRYHGDGRTPSLEPDFRPHPSAGEDSLPPTWLWDHPEKKIIFEISFNASEVEGSHTYSLEASNSGSEVVERNFTVASSG